MCALGSLSAAPLFVFVRAFTPRFFPACKAVPPELLPILGPDGTTALPAIVHAVEELTSAGIQKVVIVVQPDTEVYYSKLFKERVPQKFVKDPAALAAETRLLELGRCVTLVRQEQQEGLGHAVLCAREAVGDSGSFVV